LPEITVVMPAHNAQATIKLAIESTLRALPKDSQVLVWSDASTDSTCSIVSGIRDPRVKLFAHEGHPVGPGRARTELMNRSDSRLIALMDSDDICLPHRFSVQVSMLEDADMVFGAALWFGTGIAGLRPTSPWRYTNADTGIALLHHMPFSNPTALMAREAVEELGGFRSTDVAEDYEFVLRAALSEKRILRTGIPVVLYRRSVGQVSQEDDYAERTRSEPTLWRTFSEHVNRVLPRLDWRTIASSAALTPAERQDFFTELALLTRRMSPALRGRYRRYAIRNVATMVATGRDHQV